MGMPRTKRRGGKTYHMVDRSSSKSDAEEEADWFKLRGYSTLVVRNPYEGDYALFIYHPEGFDPDGVGHLEE